MKEGKGLVPPSAGPSGLRSPEPDQIADVSKMSKLGVLRGPKDFFPLGNATKPLCPSCSWPDHLPWCTHGMIQVVPG